MKSTKTIYNVDDDHRILIRDTLEIVIDQIRIIKAADGQILLDILALHRQYHSRP